MGCAAGAVGGAAFGGGLGLEVLGCLRVVGNLLLLLGGVVTLELDFGAGVADLLEDLAESEELELAAALQVGLTSAVMPVPKRLTPPRAASSARTSAVDSMPSSPEPPYSAQVVTVVVNGSGLATASTQPWTCSNAGRTPTNVASISSVSALSNVRRALTAPSSSSVSSPRSVLSVARVASMAPVSVSTWPSSAARAAAMARSPCRPSLRARAGLRRWCRSAQSRRVGTRRAVPRGNRWRQRSRVCHRCRWSCRWVRRWLLGSWRAP